MSLANRILRTGNALTLEAVRQAAPAVFATQPHVTRGPRYEYIPTIQPLEKLLDGGWGVFQATQNRARQLDREGFCRHSLNLRQLDAGKNKYGGALDGSLELSITNAHDGTAAYTLQANYFRMVCSNTMTTGRSIASTKIIHSKGRSTGMIIDVVARLVEEDFPRMVRQIDLFKQCELTHEQTYELAEEALRLRYGPKPATFEVASLLKVRREVDAGYNAWAVLNRIQENVLQGGWKEKSALTGRGSNVRPVEGIVPMQKINTGLWTKCEELVQA
jgi:hypothetical protein